MKDISAWMICPAQPTWIDLCKRKCRSFKTFKAWSKSKSSNSIKTGNRLKKCCRTSTCCRKRRRHRGWIYLSYSQAMIQLISATSFSSKYRLPDTQLTFRTNLRRKASWEYVLRFTRSTCKVKTQYCILTNASSSIWLKCWRLKSSRA